ncbi:Serine/threonine-protein kinase AFC2 [Platanthera guangdongensis]|uniref:non-specific serine/threonine protein kinase n=1 Tax=Platanthera guangdongensis TaxID=2320717 RepID=A0ABR2MSU2_9ASPA
MGEDQSSPSCLRSKHRRSSNEASDYDYKRRKHHHRRHHHDRHHHQNQYEKYREEDGDETIVIEKTLLEHGTQKMSVDYEREEGEIFEEEDDGRGEVAGLAAEADSEVESGEIKMDSVEMLTLIKEPSCKEDLLQDDHLDSFTSNKKMDMICCGNENDRDGDFLSATIGNALDNAGEYEDLAGCEAEKKSMISIKCPEKENCSVTGIHDFRSRERSMSPDSKDCLNYSCKNDQLCRYSSCNSEEDKSKQKFELDDDESRGSVSKSQSISPRSSRGKCIEIAQSSSWEVGDKSQPVAEDHRNGRLYEHHRGTDADVSFRTIQSVRPMNERSNDGHERSIGYERLDKFTTRSQVVDIEVQERHDRHDRCRSRDGGREEVDRRRSSRDRVDEVERHSSGYRDREREKSRSSSRYDERKDKRDFRYGEGEREREKEKYYRRDRERELERGSRDRFRESERNRNLKDERIRDDRENDRSRDRKTHSLSERDQVDQKVRDYRSNHNRQRDSRQSKYEDTAYRKERATGKDATFNIHGEEKQKSLREEDEEDYQGRIEQQLAEQDEEDIEKIKEESRKRRQAILEKYKRQQNPKHSEPPPNTHKQVEELLSMEKNGMQPLREKDDSFSNTGLDELMEQHDPSDAYVVDPSFSVGKSPVQNGLSLPENTSAACGLGEGSPKSERSTDMFCDDIFGESPAGVRKMGKDDFMKVDGSGLHDNWDDAEGYYSHRLGEVLDGRYEVIAAHGKGVFSTVVRVKDLKAGKGDPDEVAIKIIRSNDTMYKAGMEELVILKKLAGADPEDRRHCVRFLSSFKYRNHLCLVFESLHMNLREVLKKFGRNIGLRLTAVRAYAKQLFIALKHLRNCGVLHCDIKPDNMLVNEAKNVLKLCDFGNAMFAGKNDLTPYLVSRFYRAPEIILGLPYDHPLDIWSVGCCLFELYTGKVLFPGPSNNDMLRLHMELKGPFPKKMLRKGAFIDKHYDQDLNFHATEEDPVTKKTVKRLLLNIKPKDIGSLISGSPGEDPKMLANFKDLLERVFILDPEKRMTVSQALSHPFITGK